jgi:hypothetical protein
MKLFQLLVAALLLASSASVFAEKPDPTENPPLQVREANTDTSGYIAVHEQGTADVNVTGGTINANVTGGSITVDNTDANPVPIAGSVGVNNFPGEQGVWVDGGNMSPVTKAYWDVWNIDAGESQGPHYFSIGPILATTIHVSDGDEETVVTFFSSSLHPDGNHQILTVFDNAGAAPDHFFTFPNPVEIDAVKVSCLNESETCSVGVTVVGF